MRMEDDGMRDEQNCEGCVYYHEPDLVDFKVCNFPWFDHTPEDELLMECLSEKEDKTCQE